MEDKTTVEVESSAPALEQESLLKQRSVSIEKSVQEDTTTSEGSVAHKIKHIIKQIDRTVLPAKLSYVFEVGRKMMTQAMLMMMTDL